ncbi:hypothetical protein H5410_056834 [Solanum commersonii]|uniref:Uncharacterized protein n=1 Tax=Solanum commersonii TaxID=4109 RepID=A0A9J5WNE0_SOLCO|nr:hypothetical protein H5410_056834 [Solanum commersonii]
MTTTSTKLKITFNRNVDDSCNIQIKHCVGLKLRYDENQSILRTSDPLICFRGYTNNCLHLYLEVDMIYL